MYSYQIRFVAGQPLLVPKFWNEHAKDRVDADVYKCNMVGDQPFYTPAYLNEYAKDRVDVYKCNMVGDQPFYTPVYLKYSRKHKEHYLPDYVEYKRTTVGVYVPKWNIKPKVNIPLLPTIPQLPSNSTPDKATPKNNVKIRVKATMGRFVFFGCLTAAYLGILVIVQQHEKEDMAAARKEFIQRMNQPLTDMGFTRDICEGKISELEGRGAVTEHDRFKLRVYRRRLDLLKRC